MDEGGEIMITLYSGTPGSGKSFHATVLGLRFLSRGRSLITNYPLKIDNKKYKGNYFYMPNEEITVKKLLSMSLKYGFLGKESSCLLIIDEAGCKFNSREYNSKDRMSWIEFFSQHRKLGFDIVMVAQNDRMIDRQIRALFEYEVKHRKLNNIIEWLIIPIPIFVCVEYYYGMGLKIGSYFMVFNKRIPRLYDSMMIFNNYKLGSLLESLKEGKDFDYGNVAIDAVINKNEEKAG